MTLTFLFVVLSNSLVLASSSADQSSMPTGVWNRNSVNPVTHQTLMQRVEQSAKVWQTTIEQVYGPMKSTFSVEQILSGQTGPNYQSEQASGTKYVDLK